MTNLASLRSASASVSNDTNLDYGALIRASRRLEKQAAPEAEVLRIALLSDSATQQFASLLRALIHRRGIFAEVYEAPCQNTNTG
jgi:hypothetical protein